MLCFVIVAIIDMFQISEAQPRRRHNTGAVLLPHRPGGEKEMFREEVTRK